MIELSILDLLRLVLTFFLVVIGTLLTIAMLRVLRILKVGVELADYYDEVKKVIVYYAMVPYVIKDKIFESLSRDKKNTEEKDPIL
ncbi:hypothetical protein GW846_04620 [Candidatus Gracilibacteria bacterium]|nr:hypothetical protein [Candidatus Gracilibacteria bacterium]